MISEKARAKINLFLHVTGKRPDGYHLLSSLVVFSEDVYDLIHISPADAFSFEVLNAPKIEDSDNLAYKAAHAFSELTGKELRCKITLDKKLPIAGGVGGGSADAAATIRALEKFWSVLPGKKNTSSVKRDKDFDKMLLSLGADVPVCYFNQSCLMRGVGEIIEPLPYALPDFKIEIENPGFEVSTKAVFDAFNGIFAADIQSKDLPKWKNVHEMSAWLNQDSLNSLEAAARKVANGSLPGIKEGSLLTRMSGSGPTVFHIFE